MKTTKLKWWKLIVTWLLFLGLHFSYETFPNTLFKIIGEEGETSYFHMKMLFFAYIFVSIVEFFIERRKIVSSQNFVYSRLFVAIIFPWVTTNVFFLAQAVTGEMLEMPWEIIYANIITIFGIYFALRVEEALADVEYRPAFKYSILLIFLVTLFTYIVFSFNTPEHFFTTPDFDHH
jgi:hypothetical protein